MTQRKCLTCGRTEDQPVSMGCRDCQGWGGEPAYAGTARALQHPSSNLAAALVVAAMNASGATTESERQMILRALAAYEKARREHEY